MKYVEKHHFITVYVLVSVFSCTFVVAYFNLPANIVLTLGNSMGELGAEPPCYVLTLGAGTSIINMV